MSQHHHTRDLLLGIAIGGAIGAIAALLLTPKKGEDIREDIADSIPNFKEKVFSFSKDNPYLVGGIVTAVIASLSKLLLTPGTAHRLQEHLSDVYEEVSERTKDFISNLSEKADQISKIASHRGSGWGGKNSFYNRMFGRRSANLGWCCASCCKTCQI